MITANRADVVRIVLSIIRTQVVETLVIPLATQTRDPCSFSLLSNLRPSIKRSLKLGHVSTSTRPSATALPGSK
jgi:hypothetical protein